MAIFTTRAATIDDAVGLAPRLQQADKNEIWAMNRHTPLQALVSATKNDEGSMVWCADQVPVMMFGCPRMGFLSPYIGTPWLLGSDLILKYPKAFLRHNIATLYGWQRRYRLLENYVDSRHSVAVKWLAWLGFKIEKPQPIGVDKVLFHKFTIRGFHV